jgi:putative SOS response-associated peptidase YedK
VESRPDTADAGCHPIDGRQTRPEDDALGSAASLGQRPEAILFTFNARSEEFMTKPAFRDAWKRGPRCLIVTDGFYEWKKLDEKGKEKQPYAIGMENGMEMVMAGLWSSWRDPSNGEEVLSCTILVRAERGHGRASRPHALYSG